MKTRIRQITMLAFGAALAVPAFAGPRHGHDYYVQARVVHVRPIYETVHVMVPQQQCWTEPAAYRGHVGRGAELVGAMVGAAVGHQIGEGKGKALATAAGAVIGAGIAHDARHYRQDAYGYNYPVQRCESRPAYVSEQRIVGYHVKYKYNGRVFHTRTAHHPGHSLRVRIDVAAAEW